MRVDIYTKFTQKINNFDELFKYLNLGSYDYEKYSKVVDMNLKFKNYNSLNDIWVRNQIDYQTLQDLQTFLRSKND